MKPNALLRLQRLSATQQLFKLAREAKAFPQQNHEASYLKNTFLVIKNLKNVHSDKIPVVSSEIFTT